MDTSDDAGRTNPADQPSVIHRAHFIHRRGPGRKSAQVLDAALHQSVQRGSLGIGQSVEQHMLPATIMRAADVDETHFLGTRFAEGLDDLKDGGEARLRVMDDAGVDVQILSAAAHPVQQLPPRQSTELSRQLNDTMASITAANPDRFRFFTTLPVSDPASSVDELRRGVEVLGSVGVMIHGQTNGVFLDHPSMRPILAEIDRLGVPLYLHPGFPPPAVARAYYSGLEPAVGQMPSQGGWGWHAECGLHVLRIVAGLVLERFPRLQLVVGHMGENLPFSLARADEWLTPLIAGLTGSVADQIRAHVHITTSGYTAVAPLLCAQQVFGADRILFAVDYPYSDSAAAVRFLDAPPISPPDREKIAHANAEALLGLT